ncbi:phosphoribosylanthranilate isomerase [Desulfogranum japonicum]|uniref:phosphoribosylanthranilate isomerase n=1 Tax=Desulfogranum japonicum TaxID=231447 RepID=UPI0003FB4D87|nr:phosphoribosylanthranilate isomerase [Desulfogranum japonicum]
MIGNQRVRVKICGITRFDDAVTAVRAGVDALGFIFYEQSPRYIDPEEAKIILDELPPFVDSVGVFVDKKRKEVEEIIDYCRLDYVQLHGEESPKYCERLARFASPCEVLKAFRVGPHLTPETIVDYSPYVRGFLFDTYKKGEKGGTGEVFDWSVIKKLNLRKPYLLAGGLDVENISKALKSVKPFGVDANSGLETAPGRKNHALIVDFIQKVRAFEYQQLVRHE